MRMKKDDKSGGDGEMAEGAAILFSPRIHIPAHLEHGWIFVP